VRVVAPDIEGVDPTGASAYGETMDIADDIAAEIGDTPLVSLDSFADNLASIRLTRGRR
jgi:hypothetical protein